jgi:hypothetical protein
MVLTQSKPSQLNVSGNLNPSFIDLRLTEKLSGFTAESSMMFAHPTRLADLYTPEVERIYLPERHYPEVTLEITAKTGNTGERHFKSLKAKAYQGLRRTLNQVSHLDRSGQFVFDARFDTDKNIAHVIDHIAFPVLFAKRALTEKLGQPITIHVILGKKAVSLATRVYETLGIPIICTDDIVHGNIVTVSSHEIYSAIPDLTNIDLGEPSEPTPERIFVPRRGDRSIINNSEIANFLEQRGFVTCYFEKYTPRQQWTMMRHAKEIVIVHGAAGSHMQFNRVGLDGDGPGPAIMEIFSPYFVLRGWRHLAPLMNGKWCAVRGQITPDTVRTIDFTDWGRKLSPLLAPIKRPFHVDVDTVAMGLDYLEII